MVLAHGVVVRFRCGFDRVVEALRSISIASKVYLEVFDTRPRVAVAVGEKYFFRAGNSLAATTIVVERGPGEVIVKVIATGARSGVFDFFDMGSSEDYTYLILYELAKRLGTGYDILAEVSRLDLSKSHKLHVT